MSNEREIINRILSGDVDAYERLVEKNKQHVFKILSKHLPLTDVDEMSQVVFVKAYQSLSSFRGESPLEHWFSRITLRTCYDYWRERKKRKEILMNSAEMQALDINDSVARFQEECSANKAREVLEQAMSRLSADDRMVVTLHHIEGYSEKETANLLGWSVAKVKFRAFKSRQSLAQILQKIFSPRVV